MDFGSLKSSLRQLLGRDPFALAFVAATDELSKRLRILNMEVEADITVISGRAPLPSDCEEVQELYVDSPRLYLRPTTAESASSYGDRGRPVRYIVGNGEVRIVPAPDDGFPLRLVYYQTLDDLVVDSDTNPALEHAPTAYIYSALAHHSKLIRNHEAAAEFAGEAEKSIAAANRATLRARYSGGTLEPRATGIAVV